MHIRLHSITLIVLAALTGGEISARTLTLKDCMRYAVENSTKVKLQQTGNDNARIARRDAILNAFTPEVSSGTYAYWNFGRSVDPETNTYVSTSSFNNGYSVSAGITLFNGFQAVNNLKITKTALKMGICEEQQIKDEICLATMEAYYNVLYYQRLAEIIAEQVETARASLTLAVRQEELGQKGYADIIEMEAELADREYSLISTKNLYSNAIITLRDIMMWPMDEELEIDASPADSEYIAMLHPADEIASLKESALSHIPSIAVAKAAFDNAATDLNTAKWRFTPSLSLHTGWSTSFYTYPGQKGYVPLPYWSQLRNNSGEYIQLSLSIPIYSRLSNWSDLRRKKNAYRSAELQYSQKMRDVEAEVTRAVQDRDGAEAEFRQAERREEVQEEAYHLNVKKLEQGLISPLDFRKASDNWLKAQSDRLRALLTYYIKKSVVDYYSGIPYYEDI